MKQISEGINRIEYARPSPLNLLKLFRSNPGAITRYETYKRLSLDRAYSSIVSDYRKISEGLWCMRFEYYFSKDTEVYTNKSQTDSFYELEYFFIPNQSVLLSDGRQKLSLNSQVVFNSSAYQKTWLIPAGSKFSTCKFVFSREFLEENLYIDDVILQDTILQKIIDNQEPYYNRTAYKEELRILKDLEEICANKQTRLLQIISVKAKVLELFCTYFDVQIHPSDDSVEGGDLSSAIELMKENVEEGFPGLSDLAKVSNTSIPTFQRRFKSLFLTTPEKYFRHLQMEEAEQMLKKPGMTVREVAIYLGYVNPRNFSECFKKMKGFLPSEVKN